MKLIPLQTVLDAIGFEKGVADTQITAALEGATTELEGLLRTTFARETLTDQFFIPMNRVNKFAYGRHQARLALTKGLLIADPVVKHAYSYEALEDADVVEAKNFKANAVLGSVLLTGINLDESLVTVSYTAGFGPDADDETVYDQTAVPDWLKEAAKLQTILLLDVANPTLRQDDKVPRNAELLGSLLQTKVAMKIRYFPVAIYPEG